MISKFIRAQMILFVMLFGLVVPVASLGMGGEGVKTPFETSGQFEELTVGSEHPEYGTYLGTDEEGYPQYSIDLSSNSKALAMVMMTDTNKYVWDDAGDGFLILANDVVYEMRYDDTTMDVGRFSDNIYYESWLSFEIGDLVRYSSVTKSIDQVDIYLKTQVKWNLEGNEVVQFRKIETNNKCGNGGDSDCDSGQEITDMSRSSSYLDVPTSEFTAGVWENIDITAKSWLELGDNGQINFYLEEDNFDPSSSREEIFFWTADSSDAPYLAVSYTLWATPTATAANIGNEPTYLLPGQTYNVSTIVSDADGYANINYAYLHISADHSTNLIRFDWSQSSGLFSPGLGSSYCTLNTTTSSAISAGNSVTLYWVFTVTVNWQKEYMDWGNLATDDQAKSSGTNWNNIDTWHPDGFWLYDLDVYWTSEAVYLEDGDYVQVSEGLNITGYVY